MSAPREGYALTLMVAYASTMLGQIASQVFFFLILRYLAVEDVGAYSWSLAVATIYAYVMDLGLATFLVGELSRAKYPLKAVAKVVMYARAPLVLIALIGLQAWSYFAAPSSAHYWTLALITATFLIQLVDVGMIPWFQIQGRQNVVNLIGLIVPIGRLLGIGVPLACGVAISLSVVVAVTLATQVLGTAAILVAACTFDRDAGEEGGGARELLRRFWTRGPRLAVMYSLNILQARLDWLLVSALLSQVALAHYSLANKVVEAAMLLAGVWARTSFPWFSRADANEPDARERLGQLRRVFVVACGLLGVVLFFWSVPIVKYFFANKYADADDATRLMTAATAVFMLNQYLFYVVLASGLEKRYSFIILAATLVQAAVNVYLLPRFGIAGAAIAMLVMGAIMHVGQLFLLCRHGTLDRRETVRLEVFLVIALIGFGLTYAFRFGPVVGSLVMFVVVGLTSAFIVMNANDHRQIGTWLKRIIPISGSSAR